MKNNAEYLESVMKKYGEAKSKRRRRINVITSAAICLTLLISVSSVTIIGNDRITHDPDVSYGGEYDAASRSEGLASVAASISPSPSVSAEYEINSDNVQEDIEQGVPTASDNLPQEDGDIAGIGSDPHQQPSRDDTASRPEISSQNNVSSKNNSYNGFGDGKMNYDSTDEKDFHDAAFVISIIAVVVIVSCVIILIVNNLKRKKD